MNLKAHPTTKHNSPKREGEKGHRMGSYSSIRAFGALLHRFSNGVPFKRSNSVALRTKSISLIVVEFSSFAMALEVNIGIVMIQGLVFCPRTHHHFHQSRRGYRCTRLSLVFE